MAKKGGGEGGEGEDGSGGGGGTSQVAGQVHSSESTHSPFESLCLLRGRQSANILPGFLKQPKAFESRQAWLSQQEAKWSDGGPA